MISAVEYKTYDRCIIASEWRYAAAILGIIRCLRYTESSFKIEDDALYYRYEDIMNDDLYRKYIEYHYKDKLHHKLIENILEADTFTPEQIKLVNDKMKANSIAKKVFKGVKFEGNNKGEILTLIRDNRDELIDSTFKNADFGYRGYANENCYRSECNQTCRLKGFNVDKGRKSKNLAFNWDLKTLDTNDYLEFDYIPFAFTLTHDSFFINNNFSINHLVNANAELQKNVLEYITQAEDAKQTMGEVLYYNLAISAEFNLNNVEVINKNTRSDVYQTIFLRHAASKIFRCIVDSKIIVRHLSYGIKLEGKDNYLNILGEVNRHILNLTKLDTLIERLLKIRTKESFNLSYKISKVILINQIIYQEGEKLDDKRCKQAKNVAKKIVTKMKSRKTEKKITSYRNKLIASLVSHNYDRFNEILLQLSSYSQIPMEFAYDLFEDFEANKNIAYTFVNALEDHSQKKGE